MIRQAHPLDVSKLLHLAELYGAEAKTSGSLMPEWEPELAIHNFLAAINNPAHLALVCIKDGKPVGLLWAVACNPFPWSYRFSAECLMFYVHPDYRGSFIFPRLLSELVRWSEAMGCDDLRISTVSGVDTSRVETLFSHKGFVPLGTCYIKQRSNP